METSIATIIVASVAAIPGVLAYLAQRRKDQADAAEILTGAATALVIPLRAEIAELREELEYLRVENELLRAWAKQLVMQVIELGGKPMPEPEVPPRKKQRAEKS